jgi:hypothetical protein
VIAREATGTGKATRISNVEIKILVYEYMNKETNVQSDPARAMMQRVAAVACVSDSDRSVLTSLSSAVIMAVICAIEPYSLEHLGRFYGGCVQCNVKLKLVLIYSPALPLDLSNLDN